MSCANTSNCANPEASSMGPRTDPSHKRKVIDSHPALSALDFTCTIFFTLELILRFLVSPNKLKFCYNPMNIMDLLALVPLYVQIIFEHGDLKSKFINERFVIEIMFILRIFRMFRIFHLVKHYQALKVLVYALMESLQELLMLFIFLLIGMLIFATMIYYAEREEGEFPDNYNGTRTKFQTIPIGFWWAIITMTTVGYGDVTPHSFMGYVVGSACSISGVLLLALTIPVISNNFALFYQHVTSRSTSTLKKDESEKEEEDSETEPEFPPDYGALKMHNLSTSGGAPNGYSSTVLNGCDTPIEEEAKVPVSKPNYVPIAKFSERSSMNDISFHEPTAELTGIRIQTPNIQRGERVLQFKDSPTPTDEINIKFNTREIL